MSTRAHGASCGMNWRRVCRPDAGSPACAVTPRHRERMRRCGHIRWSSAGWLLRYSVFFADLPVTLVEVR